MQLGLAREDRAALFVMVALSRQRASLAPKRLTFCENRYIRARPKRLSQRSTAALVLDLNEPAR